MEETCPAMEVHEDRKETVKVIVTKEKSPSIKPLFKCGDCEYSSWRESDTVTHKDTKHTEKSTKLTEKHAVTSEIECIEELTCRNCDFEADDPRTLKQHSKSMHPDTKEVELRCNECPFQTKEENSLKVHLQASHKSLVVNIEKMDQLEIEIKCDQCDYKCKLNKQLQNHKKTKHIESTSTKSLKCPFCDSQCESVETFKEHLKQIHGMEETNTNKAGAPDNMAEPFPCSECNLVFATFNLLVKHMANHTPNCRYCDYKTRNNEELENHMIAEHEDVIIVHSMAKEVTEIKDGLAKQETFKVELSNTLKLLFDNQEILDKKLSAILTRLESPVAPPSTSPPPPVTNPLPSVPPTSPPFASTTATSSPVGKILLVGDSISGQLHTKTIEYATKAKVRKVKAYSSTYENTTNDLKHAPKFPNKNFKDVIENELDREDVDVLLVQSGSVDITNLKTEGKNENKFEYFKEQTITSATNLFKSVTNAAKNHSSLQKIILLKQTPRFDATSTTTPGMKQKLSKLYNETIDILAASSDCKDKIIIGNHDLDCSGGVLLARYKDCISGKFDGLHMFGPSGQKAYTNSVMKVLSSAQLVVSIPPKYYEEYDHQNCPQSRYQARQRNNIREEKKGLDSGHNEYQYSVKTHNRFTTLGDYFPGNF